jgi:hypothetical protein
MLLLRPRLLKLKVSNRNLLRIGILTIIGRGIVVAKRIYLRSL